TFLARPCKRKRFKRREICPLVFLPQMSAQTFVLESTQVELSSGQGLDQALVSGGEEDVQSRIRSFVSRTGSLTFCRGRSRGEDRPGWRGIPGSAGRRPAKLRAKPAGCRCSSSSAPNG